ncbi:acetyl/propionyl/methylcrotonyl-CoA carboxylase subunit alpha [Nocardioides agariphilus]|uniref:acetyl/propionyl/methylcrotonyl-CoA carboxylase subunit alpha n=1 Tax=Nocardioides agariphilus TaxID=433664 RepID=UPI003522A011
MARPITTVLVANRGEIALRVIRACRETGRRSVAIYTATDRDAPHARAADDAIEVGSYLDIEAVVAAAQQARADAVHPGYGFLSERAAFAAALEQAEIRLVGPSARVMDKMGRKDAARDIAVRAGVPVVPSFELAGFETGASAPSSTSEVAFPVLVKAAAGGGGKGMRIVRRAEDFDEAVAAAKREALSAFGDDTILVEKYVEHGRHIEVQVLADHHGNVVHLHERDCSTQRRHQKVLEEAPAPTISDGVRRLVTDSAVALAREVGYTNAGTVEFLLDVDTDEAYFLEMNTRLQVEHPVTEAITGLDLVHLQLDIAAGKPLPFKQDDIAVTGHAIEARVYAEDSFGGFLPQAGRTSLVRWPEGAGIRVDQALESGQVVSTSYDPMLGKVIAHGPDREAARRALLGALDRTGILGLTTNTGFLRALVASDEFRQARIDTAWLDTAEVAAPDADVPRVFVAWVQAMLAATTDSGHPFQADGWRLGGPAADTRVELDRPVLVGRDSVGEHRVRMLSAANHMAVLEIDGRREQAVVNVQPHIAEVCWRGQRFVFDRPDVFADHGLLAGDGAVVAPMPGTVLEVRVAVGQSVAEGDVLGVVEAMKMELALKAPFAGTVSAVDAVAGEQVSLGDQLFMVSTSSTSSTTSTTEGEA